jgi:hypothetical protein
MIKFPFTPKQEEFRQRLKQEGMRDLSNDLVYLDLLLFFTEEFSKGLCLTEEQKEKAEKYRKELTN